MTGSDSRTQNADEPTADGPGCQTCGSPCILCGTRERAESERYLHVFHGECFCDECYEEMQREL